MGVVVVVGNHLYDYALLNPIVYGMCEGLIPWYFHTHHVAFCRQYLDLIFLNERDRELGQNLGLNPLWVLKQRIL